MAEASRRAYATCTTPSRNGVDTEINLRMQTLTSPPSSFSQACNKHATVSATRSRQAPRKSPKTQILCTETRRRHTSETHQLLPCLNQLQCIHASARDTEQAHSSRSAVARLVYWQSQRDCYQIYVPSQSCPVWLITPSEAHTSSNGRGRAADTARNKLEGNRRCTSLLTFPLPLLLLSLSLSPSLVFALYIYIYYLRMSVHRLSQL